MPAKSLNTPMRLPLYTALETRTSLAPFVKDSRLYNGYAEFNATDNSYWVYKRVGLGSPVFTASGTGLGLYTEAATETLFAIFGTTLYFAAPPTSPFQPLGTVTGGAAYEWVSVGTGTNRFAVLGNGLNAYYVRQASLHPPFWVLAPITDPNFPIPFAPGWCYLDGFLYVMDTNGNIFGSSNQNDPTTWSALNQIPASSNADLGVALAKQLNYVIAFKQYTTQVFYDEGNPPPGSPLGSVPDAQSPLGCLAATSVQEIDNSLLWLTSNETISPQVVQMDSLVPRIVSTPSVERILDNVTWNTANADIRSWVLKHAGHRFYGLTLVANNVTLIYDLDQKGWYFWTDALGNFWPIIAMAYQSPGAGDEGVHLGQHISNGAIYPIDGDYAFPSDNGILFPVDIYAPEFDAGVDRRKMVNMLRINADQTNGSKLQVRYSDDDYQSWSNFRTIDLSKERPTLPSGGTFRKRSYHFRHQCNTTLRLRTVDLQLDVGVL